MGGHQWVNNDKEYLIGLPYDGDFRMEFRKLESSDFWLKDQND